MSECPPRTSRQKYRAIRALLAPVRRRRTLFGLWYLDELVRVLLDLPPSDEPEPPTKILRSMLRPTRRGRRTRVR